MALSNGPHSTFHLAILSLSCFCSFVQEHGAQMSAPIHAPSNFFSTNGYSAKPLSLGWRWNNFKKNSAWVNSHFFGIPRDAKEAQEILSVALKNNRSILTWAAIISGGLLLASAGTWLYKKRLEKRFTEEYNKRSQQLNEGKIRETTPLSPFLQSVPARVPALRELTEGLALTAAIVFLGTFSWRCVYIRKLQEFAAS